MTAKVNIKPPRYWNNKQHQRQFLDEVYSKLNLQSTTDWYKVTNNDIRKLGGRQLLRHYHESLFTALKENYPEHTWNPLLRAHKRNRFWESNNAQRDFMEYVAKSLNFKSKDDWYSLSTQRFGELGGYTLLQKYGSLYLCLSSIYPETNWDLFRISSNKKNHLYNNNDINNDSNNDSNNVITLSMTCKPNVNSHIFRFILSIQKKFDIERKEEWLRISNHHLRRLGGDFIVKSGGIITYLISLHHDQQWSPPLPSSSSSSSSLLRRGGNSKRSQQFLLFKSLKRILFNTHLIIEEYRHPQLLSSSSHNHHLLLDIYLPTLNLGVEYQGEQHYEEVHPFITSTYHQSRDHLKLQRFSQLGVTILPVPYWWDGSLPPLYLLFRSYLPHICSSP